MDAKTVGAVAALTGVSVRTLHHYDHIGLVVPSVRTTAGYRGYTAADIERLQLVLVYRAVGLPLDEIGVLLDDQAVDVTAHLRRQRALLHERAEHLQHMITALEKLMDAHRSGIRLTTEEQAEIFGTTAFSDEYTAEAEERWGDTEGWRQSRQRTATFTNGDWRQIKADGEALLANLAQAKRDGIDPGSACANELAREHRASIERFYDCSDEMHVGLAQMYVADERFRSYYDAAEPGLARYVHDMLVASIDG